MKLRPDPRPQVIRDGEQYLLAGERCTACGYASAVPRGRCPDCLASSRSSRFGPTGQVWASTVVRIPVPGRTPPYTLAYVDLDDGPRLLAHVRNQRSVVPIGTRVRLTAPETGDVYVEVVE